VAGCVLVIALIAFLVVKPAWCNNKEPFDHVSQRNDIEMEEDTGMSQESRRIV
jgi:hypothetical protein